ncbi:MAG: STAS domain-containing protein [Thioalkalispiraceae bacterium]|jgi:phospholipid transport system transporter-binding protein
MNNPRLEKIDKQHYSLAGELTMKNVPQVARESAPLVARMEGEIVIDLSGITRADSAGLALLLEWLRLTRRQNVNLRFEQLPKQLMSIARVCELHSVLPIIH